MKKNKRQPKIVDEGEVIKVVVWRRCEDGTKGKGAIPYETS